jgi:hypothetical protein
LSDRKRSVAITLELFVKSTELLIELLLELLQILPIDATSPSVLTHPSPGQLQVLPLVNLVHQ